MLSSPFGGSLSRPKISVLILAQNVQRTLKRCLDSVKDFDQIIVLDGGSTDQTPTIAKSYPNVKYVVNAWPGFIEQRNLSIDLADHSWCFMIDSDEALEPEARDEIFRIVSLPNPKVMYRIVRTEYFLGQAIEEGFGRSDYQERLFQKSRIRYTGGVHHGHLIDGQPLAMNHPEAENMPRQFRVLHDPAYGMDDWLKKFPRFTILIAHEKMKRGRRVTPIDILATLFGTFFQIYLKSWRQGKMALATAVLETINRTMVKLYIYQSQQFHQNSSEEFRKKLG